MRDEEENFKKEKFGEGKFDVPLTINRKHRMRFTFSKSNARDFKLSMGKLVGIIIIACTVALAVGYAYTMLAFR